MRKRPAAKSAKAISDASPEKKHFHGKRVVIVDDHPLIRRGLERMIHSDDGFVVCGEAGNARDALAVVARVLPDLAIVDIGLPDRDGIQLTRELVRDFPNLIVLILSMHEEAEYAERALEAGAKGYMVKHDAVEGIGSALESVINGKTYLSPAIRGVVRKPGKKRGPSPIAGPGISAPKSVPARRFQAALLI